MDFAIYEIDLLLDATIDLLEEKKRLQGVTFDPHMLKVLHNDVLTLIEIRDKLVKERNKIDEEIKNNER